MTTMMVGMMMMLVMFWRSKEQNDLEIMLTLSFTVKSVKVPDNQ